MGGGWDVHMWVVVGMYTCGWWLGCTHVVVVGMYTCVRLWVCTCGGVGGGWDVHMCDVMGVYMW